MKQVVQITVLLVELGGLFFAVRLLHARKFFDAFQIFLFETIILIVFVVTHRVIDRILKPPTRGTKTAWWL